MTLDYEIFGLGDFALQNGAILRQGWFGAKNTLGSGLSVRGGRQFYLDGVEASAVHPNLKWIQSWRIGQRLIGPFDYTHVGRSFDGGQVAYDTDNWNLTGFGFVPTYGGFEIDANRELDITVGGLSLNLKDSPEVGPMIARQGPNTRSTPCSFQVGMPANSFPSRLGAATATMRRWPAAT